MEIVTFNGWEECIRLQNELVDVILSTRFGPRILRYGFLDEENEFAEIEEEQGKVGGDTWRMYGGHRLWHAPEADPRTYYPDNESLEWRELGDGVRLTQPVERTTGIQKEMDIRLSPVGTHVRVLHRLYNRNLWEVRLAPWALSVMLPGGTAILPMPPRLPHTDPAGLLPVNSLALWPYTDLSDSRLIWGRQYLLARQDPIIKIAQKIGAFIPGGWCAYARRGHLFIKRFAVESGATYPDRGCNVEVFINERFLELETLGPLQTIPPQGFIEHVEDWYLFRDVPTPHNDAQVERHVLTRIVETVV